MRLVETFSRLRPVSGRGSNVSIWIPRGAAARAGLRPTTRNRYGDVAYGDVIVSVDNEPVGSNEDLVGYVEKNKTVGDEVNIRFMRQNKEFGTTVTLQELGR